LINRETLDKGVPSHGRPWKNGKEAILPNPSGPATAISARFRLKAATAAAHERLDGWMSRYDLACRADYGAFLQAQAGAFMGVEDALDEADAEIHLPDWHERRRTMALRSDLNLMGLAFPEPAQVTPFRGEAEVLGAIYVLEGSRLGGAVLIRSVPDGLPKSFLSSGNPAAWRALASVLDERLSSPDRFDSAASAACSVFAVFENAARAYPGADRK
jgi:heme oxygenase